MGAKIVHLLRGAGSHRAAITIAARAEALPLGFPPSSIGRSAGICEAIDMNARYRFRPMSGPIMALATWLVVALSLAAIVAGDSVAAAARALPVGVLVSTLGWAAFWRPAMTVTANGVAVLNPFRRIELDWAAVTRIDTKYALTFFVGERKIRVWAAPAPGVMRASLLARRDFDNLSLAEAPRPGDAAGTASGDAAEIVRRMLASLSERGWSVSPDGTLAAAGSEGEEAAPASEHAGVRVRWNVVTMVLLGLSLVSALVLG